MPKKSEKVIPDKNGLFCPYCGEELDKLEGYCPHCGVDLKEGEQKTGVIEREETGMQKKGGEEKNAEKISPKNVPPSLTQSSLKTQGTRCVNCKGTGFCHSCHGAGSIRRNECVECGGTGRCSFCNGTGRL